MRHPQYSEHTIARHLAREKFSGMLMAIDNTYFAGDEADLLVVTKQLRVIDVEIKISRQDLKADRSKTKWKQNPPWPSTGPAIDRQWPRNVWKHYYCVAEPIWQDSLLEYVGPMSGVFTISIDDQYRYRGIRVRKQCKPNKQQRTLEPAELVKLAYLANIRMHEAYQKLDEQRRVHAEEYRYFQERNDLKAGVVRPQFYDETREIWSRFDLGREKLDLTPP